MNVLNVEAVERELARCATYAKHPAAKQWVMSVARNHILSNVSEKDAQNNFVLYTGKRNMNHIEMPTLAQLPDWAKKAMCENRPIHWFDTVQVRRRNLWQAIEQIVHWFNDFAATDKRWTRLDRVNFETAASAAAMWFCDVQSNLWDYVKDQPPVVYSFDDGSGFYWVKMVTPLHFERESRLMNHCVGNGSYYNLYKSGDCSYYSLRDRRNEPHATMEVTMRERGHWTSINAPNARYPSMSQVKGKGNAKPTGNYQPYIYSFVRANNWPINGDMHNIDHTRIIKGH